MVDKPAPLTVPTTPPATREAVTADQAKPVGDALAYLGYDVGDPSKDKTKLWAAVDEFKSKQAPPLPANVFGFDQKTVDAINAAEDAKAKSDLEKAQAAADAVTKGQSGGSSTDSSSGNSAPGAGMSMESMLCMLFLSCFAKEMGLGDLLGGLGGGDSSGPGGDSGAGPRTRTASGGREPFGGLGIPGFSQNDIMTWPGGAASMNDCPLVTEKNPQTGLPYLICGLIKQESGGQVNITSSAGARGLMQLMPDTARQVARDHGIPYSDSAICTPEVNLKLGQLYVQDMAKRYHGNITATLAAYNGGPKHMDDAIASLGPPRSDVTVDEAWLKKAHDAGFIRTETMNYPGLVVANAQKVYKHDHGGQSASAHADVTPSAPPHVVPPTQTQDTARAPG